MPGLLKISSRNIAAQNPAGLRIRLERSPPGCGPRYYEIALTRDLWGAPVLMRAWGGVGRARGGALQMVANCRPTKPEAIGGLSQF